LFHLFGHLPQDFGINHPGHEETQKGREKQERMRSKTHGKEKKHGLEIGFEVLLNDRDRSKLIAFLLILFDPANTLGEFASEKGDWKQEKGEEDGSKQGRTRQRKKTEENCRPLLEVDHSQEFVRVSILSESQIGEENTQVRNTRGESRLQNLKKREREREKRK
jgi:hypothetical protein